MERSAVFARIATFEDNDIPRLQKYLGKEHRAGILPPVEGVTRVVILEGERNLFLTFFESREALEAEEEKFLATGGRVPEEERGRRLGIEHYEVVYDQDGPDAWIPWLEGEH